ncbi:hypothetical protein ACFS07_01960 [Undibacterium arcticum]
MQGHTVVAHFFDDEHTDSEVIGFQQTIFGQDRPILEKPAAEADAARSSV